jgi:FxsC-like protein
VPARFFLSYANADEDNYVARFFDDLVRELQRQSGISGDEPGFRDFASLRVGAAWPQELFEALRISPTFVALCSPSYFASEFCGREWSMFAARAEHFRRIRGMSPPTLLPVLWVPAPDLPEPARQVQFTDPEFGAAYRREGLFHLMRLSRYKEDYLVLVRALAQRLLDVSRRFPMPHLDNGFPVTEVESAFHPSHEPRPADRSTTWQTFTAGLRPERSRPSVPVAGPPPRSRRPGPQHVYFVIVSAPQHLLAGVRDELKYYGPEPFHWAPYRPQLDQRIGVFAQAVAADHDLTSQLAEAADIVAVLDRAGSRNEIVVLLVDVWTTRFEAYRQHMADYDRRNEPATAVLVPWNQSDAESNANAEQLVQGLVAAFPRNAVRSDDLFRIRIGTSTAFRQELAEVLTKAQSRVFRSGEVGRWTGTESWPERPMMQFPDREDDR